MDISTFGIPVRSKILDLSDKDSDNLARFRELLGGGQYIIRSRDHITFRATNRVYTCDEVAEILNDAGVGN